MKLNNLKFKEITSAIEQKVTLNIFSHDNTLFQPRPPTSTSKVSRPRTCRDRHVYHNLNYTCPSKRNKPPLQDSLFHLQNSLTSYTESISFEERYSIYQELQDLLEVVKKGSLEVIVGKLESCEGELSRRFKNRLVHLVYYLVLNSVGSHNREKQIKNMIICEYYGRKFNFKQFTMSVCQEIQSLYCAIKNYEESRNYARKCLKLAVLMENSYLQAKMIQTLSILNYYEGRLTEGNGTLLVPEERKRIIDHYSEDKELPLIFDSQSQPSANQYKELSIESNNNFIENSVPSQNVKYFQTHYHDIFKSTSCRTLNARKIINKVSQVGLVRKYFGKQNFITIRPECHIIKPINQEQVLITHKKTQKPLQSAQNATKARRRVIALLNQAVISFSSNY